MVNENKNNAFAVLAGVVIGAGAAIAGAVTLADKGNQKKVKEALSKTKAFVETYSKRVRSRLNDAKNDVNTAGNEVNDKLIKSKATMKKVATKSIDSAIKVAKVARKKVRKI